MKDTYITQIQGIKTNIYTDVKIPVVAGMQFNSMNYKMRAIGYDVFRHYYDTIDRDMQVGSQRIKRVLKY